MEAKTEEVFAAIAEYVHQNCRRFLSQARTLLSMCFMGLITLGPSLNVHSQDQSTRPQFSQTSDAKLEVKTGAKLARGGACEYFGIKPDLVCLAKSIGGGFPLAAFATSKAIMDAIAQHKVFDSLYPRIFAQCSALSSGVKSMMSLSDTHPVLVKAASFQVMDAGSGKLLVQAVFDTKDELRITEVSRSFLDVLNETKK